MTEHIDRIAAVAGIAATIALVVRQRRWERAMLREAWRSGSPW